MITLDLNVSLLAKYFNLSAEKISQYNSMSIDEVISEEESEGNSVEQIYESEILNNPTRLVELLQLGSFSNLYAIMSNMNQTDLISLLPYLSQGALLIGLQFFSKEKLQQLIETLPKEELVKVLFSKFSHEEFLKMTENQELTKFFESDKVEKPDVMKFMVLVPADQLQNLIENITGMPTEDNSIESLIKTIQALDPEKYSTFMELMEPEQKQNIILGLTKEKPELFQEFESYTLMKPLKTLEKPELISATSALENEFLANFNSELPQELLAVVTTQIDPMVFAEILAKNFKEIVSQIAVSQMSI